MTALQQLSGPVVMDIPSDPASLFLVRCVVERLAQRMEFAGEDADRMVLAVDEACSNVVRHAYGNSPEGRIQLTFVVLPDRLEISIRDFGTPADPAAFTCRDLAEIRPGGLGVHFIRCAMDTIEYETPPDGGTLLKLVKCKTCTEGIAR